MESLVLLVTIIVLVTMAIVFVALFFLTRIILKRHFPNTRGILKVLIYLILIVLAFILTNWILSIASNPMSFIQKLLFIFILENVILLSVYLFKNFLSRIHRAWYILVVVIWLALAWLISGAIYSSLEIDAIANMSKYVQ